MKVYWISILLPRQNGRKPIINIYMHKPVQKLRYKIIFIISYRKLGNTKLDFLAGLCQTINWFRLQLIPCLNINQT